MAAADPIDSLVCDYCHKAADELTQMGHWPGVKIAPGTKIASGIVVGRGVSRSPFVCDACLLAINGTTEVGEVEMCARCTAPLDCPEESGCPTGCVTEVPVKSTVEWFPVYAAAYKVGVHSSSLLHLAGAPCGRVKPEHVMSDDRAVLRLAPEPRECCSRCWNIARRGKVKA